MSVGTFVYSPKDQDEPEKVTFAGQEWEAGKAADLADPSFLAIMMGNPFFVRKDKPKADDPKVETGQQTVTLKGNQAPGGLAPGPTPPVEPRPVEPTYKR